MINLEQNTISYVNGDSVPIRRYEVWYMTPLGLFNDREAAIIEIKKVDFPVHVIRPVAVAIAEDGMYEVAV